jgi:hypothetical protein
MHVALVHHEPTTAMLNPADAWSKSPGAEAFR